MVNRKLYTAYLFFKEHAGYCVGERAKGALALARAEQWADEYDMDYTWEYDQDPELGDHEAWCKTARRLEAGYTPEGDPIPHYWHGRDDCTHDVEVCRAEYNEEVVASLGGIIDADRNYRRVVEAELALEAQANVADFVYY